MILAIFVGFTPTFLGVNSGTDYAKGREFIFQVSVRDLDTDYSYINSQNAKTDADLAEDIEDILDEFKDRLDLAGVSNPSVELVTQTPSDPSEPTDYLIRVSYKAQYEQLYDAINDYLMFDEDISITIITTSDDQTGNFTQYSSAGTESDNTRQLFDFDEVSIDTSTGSPRVRIELADPSFFYESIYQTVVSNTSTDDDDSSDEDTDSDDEEEETTDPEAYIYVVNHWRDNYDISEAVGENSASYYTDAVNNVMYSLDTTNPDGLFEDYDSSNEDDESYEGYEAIFVDYTQYCPDLTEVTSSSVLQRLINQITQIEVYKLSSDPYDYDITLLNESYATTSTTTGRTDATVEQIAQYGNLTISTLLIATLIAFVLVALFLSLSHGILSLLGVAVTGGSVLLSAVFMTTFGVEFNIGAIVGLLITAVMALFGCYVYFKKVKESCYQGKNLKKANSEASKRTLWYQVDIAIVGLVFGITTYLFNNAILQSMGAMLILGSIFGFLLDTLVVRLCYWLLANSSYINDRLKLLRIDTKLIPNVANDEKSVYFESFKEQGAKKETKKSKLITLIVAGVLLLGSIIAIPTVNAVNGSIYGGDTSTYIGDQINIRYNIEALEDYEDGFATVSELEDQLLNKIKVLSGTSVSEDDAYLQYSEDIEVFYYYNYSSSTTENGSYYFNYIITLTEEYSEDDTFYLEDNTSVMGSLAQVVIYGINNGDFESTNGTIEVYYGNITSYTDDYLSLYILFALLIVLGVLFLYILARYGLSKSLIAFFGSAVPATITIGLYSILQISASSYNTLAAVVIIFITYLILLYYFMKEREGIRENKPNITSEDERRAVVRQYNALSYDGILLIMGIVAILFVSYLFSTTFQTSVILASIVGLFIAIILINNLLNPVEEYARDKYLAYRENREAKNKEKTKKAKKEKKQVDDGPEESIIIGIND